MKELYKIYEIMIKSYILKYKYALEKLPIEKLKSELEKFLETNDKSLKIKSLVNIMKINKLKIS